MQRCPDVSLARQKLDWAPKVPLEEGLRRTIAYFDALLREEGSPRVREVMEMATVANGSGTWQQVVKSMVSPVMPLPLPLRVAEAEQLPTARPL